MSGLLDLIESMQVVVDFVDWMFFWKTEKMTSLTEDPAFYALKKYYDLKGKTLDMRQLFKDDPDRFKKYS